MRETLPSKPCQRLAAQVRFLFPVLPLFNVAAAAALAHTWNWARRQRSTAALWQLGCGAGAAACLAVVILATKASHHNYPGEQMMRLKVACGV